MVRAIIPKINPILFSLYGTLWYNFIEILRRSQTYTQFIVLKSEKNVILLIPTKIRGRWVIAKEESINLSSNKVDVSSYRQPYDLKNVKNQYRVAGLKKKVV